MKRLFAVVAALALVAATPQETLSGLEANGYHIEDGASVTEQVVSDAVFDGRADGGRLYVVVLAEEPPGGATTFADSTLDLLDGGGYVLIVAPETVGWAGDSSFWSADEMNQAVDASLDGGSDDEVLRIFASALTSGAPIDVPGGDPGSSGDGFPLIWIVLIGAAVLGIWWLVSRRGAARKAEGRLAAVRNMAMEKLAEVANDILEMEHEVSTSGDPAVIQHYERASGMYSQAMEDTERAGTVAEMVEVSKELDLAIWELDSAEALLDGKTPPPKPEPPTIEPPPAPPVPEGHAGAGTVPPMPGYDRRPQRQSGGSNDMMTMLMALMAMGGMRNRGGGFGGGSGGWTGSGGGAPRPRMGGGRGGGRIRGGGRRRG